MTVRDSGGNVKVDFVWGNFPLQPDDDRGENTLNPALDNHIIATSGYSGFPGFETGGVFDDTVANVAVPVLTGVLAATAATRLTNAGLVGNVLATTTNGATSQNNGKVASQSPASGTVVNVGDTVSYSVYEYAVQQSLPTNLTSNWVIAGSGSVVALQAFAWSSLLDDAKNNPTNYQVVIAGVNSPYDAINGTYAITSASDNGGNTLLHISGLTLPGGQSSIAASDGNGGSISVTHV